MIKAKKSLGQNFLIDPNIIKKIISLGGDNNKHIIEIGPGTGNLSQKIISITKPKKLSVIEKDKRLCDLLEIRFKDHSNFEVFNDDILNFNLDKILTKNSIIFGNLPYNISTQILVKLIKSKIWPPKFKKLVLMFQKEVAERIVAKCNTSNYGRLSVISKWRFNIKEGFDISKHCFSPKPKVESTVLLFEPKINKDYKINNIETLEKITNVFFSGKRKMINKSIKKLFKNNNDFEKKINILQSMRPSQVSEDQYYMISEYYEKINS